MAMLTFDLDLSAIVEVVDQQQTVLPLRHNLDQYAPFRPA